MLTDTLAIKAQIAAKEYSLEIVDVGIGPKYSYAIVKGEYGRSMGTSYMPMEDITRGFVEEVSIYNISKLVSSLNMQEKSLGIALINAISQYLLWNTKNSFHIEYGNLIECVNKCCPYGNVIVIGNMIPLVKKLSKNREIKVLERNPKLRINAYPDSLAPRIVPKGDAIIITGATLINDSIDYILSLSKNAKYKILVGPSSAVYPDWIKEYVNVVASLKIIDIEKTKNIIKMGGGRWDFTPYSQEYIIHL